MKTDVLQGAEQDSTVQPEVQQSTYQEAIKTLLASGAKKITGLKVKNVNFTEKDNYDMVSFTLSSKIKGFVSEDNGLTYKEGLTNVIFSSTYAIAGAMKEDEELSWMANYLIEHPKALPIIFNGATIDIIQKGVKEGEEYKNVFSTRDNVDPVTFDHAVIINNIIKFKLGKAGQIGASRLMDKMLE